jgi:hypothetical protein
MELAAKMDLVQTGSGETKRHLHVQRRIQGSDSQLPVATVGMGESESNDAEVLITVP